MGRYSPAQLAIGVVICLAICALIYVAAGAMGVAIPYWIVQVVFILVVAVVVIAAIKFLLSLSA